MEVFLEILLTGTYVLFAIGCFVALISFTLAVWLLWAQ